MVENERRLSAYALDILQNGHWFCPSDASGELAAKPPMLTWLITLLALVTGHVGQLEIYLPTVLAAIATALVLFGAGRKYFGWQAGLFSAFSYLVCSAGFSQMATARYDGLLTLPVTLGALAAFRAWQEGRGWTWFWFWAAIGTLVKGPLALLLAGSGLAALFWCKRTGDQQRFRFGSWLGVAVFLGLTAGWFALAYWEVGPELIDKMLRRELFGQAASLDRKASLISALVSPSSAFAGNYAPWVLAVLVAFWRIFKSPADDAVERRLERFLLCWFLIGLAIFTAAAHQRGRLTYPIIPPAALLAGRELARWTRRWSASAVINAVAATGVAVLIAAGLYSHVLLKHSRKAQESITMRRLAQDIQKLGPGIFPFTYVTSPNSLQVWLQTRHLSVDEKSAAALLSGPAAAFVVVQYLDEFKTNLPPNTAVSEIYKWEPKRDDPVYIFSNHPRLEWPRRTAFLLDGLHIETDGARLVRERGTELSFELDAPDASVVISNACDRARAVALRCTKKADGSTSREEKTLAPGVTWRK